jgi:FLVCR family MFS transporter 7
MTNRNFVLLLMIFGFYVAAFNVYVTLISDYITPFGYSESDAGNLGVVTIVAGVVSALTLGALMDRFSQHDLALKCASATATLGLLVFYFGTLPNRLAILYIGAILIGTGGFPMESLSLELGVESTWPIAEGTSSGLLWTSAQVWGIIFLFLADLLREPDGSLRNALIFSTCIAGASSLLSLFFINERRRQSLEK